MGASVPLRRESLTTITHCLFLVVLVAIRGADQAALLGSSISPDVMGKAPSLVTSFLQNSTETTAAKCCSSVFPLSPHSFSVIPSK